MESPELPVKFWLQDPSVLLCEWSLLPNKSMMNNEILNSMTRLVIIVTIILFFSRIGEWLIFFLCAIFFIILAWYFQNYFIRDSEIVNKEYLRCPSRSNPDHKTPEKPKMNIKPRRYPTSR